MAKSSVAALPVLFDRAQHVTDGEALLSAAEGDNKFGHAQLAANWRMDFRVNAERQQQMFADALPAGDLSALCMRYQYEQQCLEQTGLPGPACLRGNNQNNRLPANYFAPRVHLLHLASLNSLLRFAVSRYAYGKADLEAFLLDEHGLTPPGDAADASRHREFCAALVESLQSQGSVAVSRFSGRLAEALGPKEPHWWAGMAYDLDPLLATDDWSDAADLLGLGHMPEGEWLLAWRYPAEVASPWYRPSVLEAQDSPFHFSSPPSSPVGVTMSLAMSGVGVCEVIHPALKDDDAEDFSLGRIGKLKRAYAPAVKTEKQQQAWFAQRRIEHRQLLAASYPESPDQHWLARHSSRP